MPAPAALAGSLCYNGNLIVRGRSPMATNVETNQNSKKLADINREDAATAATDPASQLAINPITEVLARAEKAYTSYIEAQREVATAYRLHEEAAERAYKEAERLANSACEESIEEALRSRQKAEKQAEQIYMKALENTAVVYEGSLKQALQVRDEAIAQAWKANKEVTRKSWGVFQGNTVGDKRA